MDNVLALIPVFVMKVSYYGFCIEVYMNLSQTTVPMLLKHTDILMYMFNKMFYCTCFTAHNNSVF